MPEGFREILAAPSLWRGVALFGAGLGASLLFAVLPLAWLRRRPRPRRLASDTRGAAAAVDFMLTMPIFIVFVSLAVQFAVALNATLVVHYAAYSAARSARAWVAEEAATSILPVQLIPFNRPVSDDVARRAESAARMALVAVSPADPGIAHQGSAPVGTMRGIASAAGLAPRGDAFAAKAGYAFDPRNSTIEVEARFRNGAPEVTASIEYRVHTGILAGRVLGSDRGDGVRSLPATASVTIQ